MGEPTNGQPQPSEPQPSLDERPNYPYAVPPPRQAGSSSNTLIFVIILVAIAILFSLIFTGMFGLYGGPGG
jgi:hypothetical protein